VTIGFGYPVETEFNAFSAIAIALYAVYSDQMTPPAARHLVTLRERTPSMLALIEQLVNIDSGSYHKPGVDQVTGLLAGHLSGLGFDVTREPLLDRGDRVMATRRLGGTGRLLILGHADTVWPAGTVEGWRFARNGERASGPGVGDMKSALVMASYALEAMLREGTAQFESIRFVLVPDEELGSVQSRDWIEREARSADWALTLEPARPGGGLVTSRGAVGALFVDALGHSAHAAVNYAKGASAVRELARLVGALEALSRPDDGVIVNVGVFQGGAARQVVPHQAQLHVDLRARTTEQSDALLAEIHRLAALPANPAVSMSVRGGWTRPAFPRSAGTQALYEATQSVAAELGIPAFEVHSSGGSDGSLAAALGIPTLDGLGPICHDTCSRDETIEIASIAERGALFAGLIERLGAAA
jgi:glutamate carboxypeptidase